MTNIQQLQQKRRFYEALLSAGDSVSPEQREHAEQSLKTIDAALKEGKESALFEGVGQRLNSDVRYAGGQRMPSEIRARIAELQAGLHEAIDIRDDKNRSLLDRREAMDLVPRIEREIAKNEHALAEANRAGFGELERRMTERNERRGQLREAEAARKARREDQKAHERALNAALDKATRIAQVARPELIKAYAAHLKSATQRGDGSLFSHHSDQYGEPYTISTEKNGAVFVSPGHE